jgi:predicted aconitase
MDTGTMRLNAEERAMYEGERGAAVRDAIRFQVDVGAFFEAERFVAVTNVHVMGDIEVMGDGGLDLVRQMSDEHAHCVVPTSSNAHCMHFDDVRDVVQDEGEMAKQRELLARYGTMRIATTDTCINYQTIYQPKLGEHVAWGDTGTVIYANSVYGARTNYEAGRASFAAALTGRTPAYGFHLDAVRRGSIAVDVRARMRDTADWGALGKIVGHPHQDYFAVPVFRGIGDMPLSDSLKQLGASLASYGSLAMFHMVGVTPEARDDAQAFGGRAPDETVTVTDEDIEAVYRAYRYVEGKTIVVFSGPQLSIFELQQLAERFAGRTVHPSMRVFATTNHQNYSEARRLGYVGMLEAAGVTFLKGVCFYILQGLTRIREDNGWTNLVSNSGKLVNTITAHRFNTVLRRTEQCVDIACTGRLS